MTGRFSLTVIGSDVVENPVTLVNLTLPSWEAVTEWFLKNEKTYGWPPGLSSSRFEAAIRGNKYIEKEIVLMRGPRQPSGYVACIEGPLTES